MSTSFGCKCPERKKPVEQRRWAVVQRNCNHSAFNGYQKAWSEYSSVICLECGNLGRTRSEFVRHLKDAVHSKDSKTGWDFAEHERKEQP